MTDEVKLLPCDDALVELIARKIYANVHHLMGVTGVRAQDAYEHAARSIIEATRPPVVIDEVVERDGLVRMPLRERIGIALMEINVRPTDRRQVGFSREEFLAAADAAIAVLYPTRATLASMPAVVSGGEG